MKAFVTNTSSLLGASLTGALRWEGHTVVGRVADADVVFETSHGVVYRKDRASARFVFEELLGPGNVAGTVVGEWLASYARTGYIADRAGGAYITDARDVALAMILTAERGLSGEFNVLGPFVSFEDVVETIGGAAPSKASVALPELGLAFRPVEETILDAYAFVQSEERSLVA